MGRHAPFNFGTAMKAAPPFRNRLFREIRNQTCKLVPVEKVRSVEDYKTTHEPHALPVGGAQPDGGRLVFEVEKKKNRQVNGVLEYFTAELHERQGQEDGPKDGVRCGD